MQALTIAQGFAAANSPDAAIAVAHDAELPLGVIQRLVVAKMRSDPE